MFYYIFQKLKIHQIFIAQYRYNKKNLSKQKSESLNLITLDAKKKLGYISKFHSNETQVSFMIKVKNFRVETRDEMPQKWCAKVIWSKRRESGKPV